MATIISSIIVPLIIGILAYLIGHKQVATQKYQIRLDLLERRMKIYETIGKTLNEIDRDFSILKVDTEPFFEMKTSIILCLLFVSVSAYSQAVKPLVIVNGMAITPGSSFADGIPIDQIMSLRTYEAQEATSMYGEFLGVNGIIEIKTRANNNGFIEIPKDVRLIYGDAKPVVLLDEKEITYEKYEALTASEVSRIEVRRDIEDVRTWGPQAINGLITVTSR